MPKVGMPEIRRPQLVEATMAVIDEVGLSGASVALISRKAGVSPGIINHYFGGKHGLLEETMRSVLRQLSATSIAYLSAVDPQDVTARIKAIVAANFDSYQVENKVVKTWLAFWAQSMHDPALYRLQRVNEKRLLSHLRRELKRVLPAQDAAFVAQGIAALIDGIWLRGALNPDGICPQQAQRIILDYLDKQLVALNASGQ
ncbi:MULTISPECIES: transcriptional regulator BetI [Photobacterium]|uniref:HTH-type transcriptional regulator BetI n=1 Tax=Photobacterium atrarenae TaxID=865757 RepID=A0ABY5GMJ2_9GAMM|nr:MULTISPECIES: transcriptional regulator BetI [Photobacterium]UTV29518.1 transcriptional regulator BetI [Photobacterium atrarenae]UXI03547.1 transcriptional regulator BetI [Photobacterium sp. TY1-4]